MDKVKLSNAMQALQNAVLDSDLFIPVATVEEYAADIRRRIAKAEAAIADLKALVGDAE